MPVKIGCLILLMFYGYAGAQTTPMFDGGGYPVVMCNADYIGRQAACTISGNAKPGNAKPDNAGPDSSHQRFVSNIISDGKIYIGGSMMVAANGRIESVGCATLATAPAKTPAKTPAKAPDTDIKTIDCPGALISAGFVNLHEHIDFSYQPLADAPKQKWQHRHQWRRLNDAERGFEVDAPKDKTVRAEVAERAMLRHALSGTTTLLGSKHYSGFLRNLRRPASTLTAPTTPTISTQPVIQSSFPLKDFSSKQWLTAPCSEEIKTSVRQKPDLPYVYHIGEGTNKGAQLEIDCMLNAVKNKRAPNAFIHAIATSKAQAKQLKAQNLAVVLSVRSNLRLYGATAPIGSLKKAGVALAMGTDWSRSGSLTMLDEARCLARNTDKNSLLNAADLHRIMTNNGAKAVGLQDEIGRLAAGQMADLVIFDTQGRNSLAELLASSALQQTIAVFVGGRAANIPPHWLAKLPTLEHCIADPRDLCGQKRVVCGANQSNRLKTILGQQMYSIDDNQICAPAPTNDCAPGWQYANNKTNNGEINND